MSEMTTIITFPELKKVVNSGKIIVKDEIIFKDRYDYINRDTNRFKKVLLDMPIILGFHEHYNRIKNKYLEITKEEQYLINTYEERRQMSSCFIKHQDPGYLTKTEIEDLRKLKDTLNSYDF